ncbi:hypothetical protein R1X32_15150 [Rhodococcus opacus]|uniref:hypothetical protein n=1 Tax=Rhodococcus sp. IEGM 1351 TaxID=3047089 RepID=UPI00146B0986|nr:hypothetical protein [Rhodococcus sp. IEGM 1351]WKN58731.1 hypothetical protein HJ581_0035980 [Rhodococcus opacus]
MCSPKPIGDSVSRIGRSAEGLRHRETRGTGALDHTVQVPDPCGGRDRRGVLAETRSDDNSAWTLPIASRLANFIVDSSSWDLSGLLSHSSSETEACT